MYIILGSATGIKILLFIYCFALKNQSGASPRACCLQKSCLAIWIAPCPIRCVTRGMYMHCSLIAFLWLSRSALACRLDAV